MFGLGLAALGFLVLGYARVSLAPLVFLGISLFAVGEMVASPRIQEYITWIAPKEKAGLYMGSNFLLRSKENNRIFKEVRGLRMLCAMLAASFPTTTIFSA